MQSRGLLSHLALRWRSLGWFWLERQLVSDAVERAGLQRITRRVPSTKLFFHRAIELPRTIIITTITSRIASHQMLPLGWPAHHPAPTARWEDSAYRTPPAIRRSVLGWRHP